MIVEYVSAIPVFIPDPEGRCLFHFTASIEGGFKLPFSLPKRNAESKDASIIFVKERSGLCTHRVKI